MVWPLIAAASVVGGTFAYAISQAMSKPQSKSKPKIPVTEGAGVAKTLRASLSAISKTELPPENATANFGDFDAIWRDDIHGSLNVEPKGTAVATVEITNIKTSPANIISFTKEFPVVWQSPDNFRIAVKYTGGDNRLPINEGAIIIAHRASTATSAEKAAVAVQSVAQMQPVRISSDPIQLENGKTYFVVLETKGSVNAAASPSAVKSQAQDLGFKDVVVFTSPPQFFPSNVKGDFYIRGTYASTPKPLARRKSVFLGSATALDVWVSA